MSFHRETVVATWVVLTYYRDGHHNVSYFSSKEAADQQATNLMNTFDTIRYAYVARLETRLSAIHKEAV